MRPCCLPEGISLCFFAAIVYIDMTPMRPTIIVGRSNSQGTAAGRKKAAARLRRQHDGPAVARLKRLGLPQSNHDNIRRVPLRPEPAVSHELKEQVNFLRNILPMGDDAISAMRRRSPSALWDCRHADRRCSRFRAGAAHALGPIPIRNGMLRQKSKRPGCMSRAFCL